MGNLQGPTPWIFHWAPGSHGLVTSHVDTTTAWFKIITSVTVIKYFWAAPLDIHVCSRRHTCLYPSFCDTFAAASTHFSYRVLNTPVFSMKSIVASMYCALVIPIPLFWCLCSTLNRSAAETPRSLKISPLPRRTTIRRVVYAHLTCPLPRNGPNLAT